MKTDLILKIFLLLTFAMASAGCQVHLGAETESTAVDEASSRYALGQEIRDIVYSEPAWPQTLRADLYLPQKHGPLPVVIVIHGGG
jgi:acetyl esterase/lipase